MKIRLFGESLKKIAQVVDFWRFFTGKTTELKQYDYETLQKAYRQKKNVRTIINLSTSLMLSGWFEVLCEDEEAQTRLNEFWVNQRKRLLHAGREGALFGNTYLGFEWQDEVVAKNIHPGAIAPIFSKAKPWEIEGWKIKTKIENVNIEETITKKDWSVVVNRREISNLKGSNPYGVLPVVHIAECVFSNEIFGSGEIDEALFDLIEKYDRVLDRGVLTEEYHGSPIPIFKGVRDTKDLKEKVEEEESWKPGMGLFMPSDSDAYFLESKRGVGNTIDLLKIIFYNIVIQSETPEYMLGVHVPASLASTKEQRSAVEMKTNRRRLVWTEALQRANEIVLRMIEYHENKKFKDYETNIKWGTVFEKDKKEEAEVIEKKSKASAMLKELEIISMETARNSLPEIIDDAEKEKERVKNEKQTQGKYGFPGKTPGEEVE